MQITVKLYASLAGHLPAGARHNQEPLDVPDDATPWSVIEHLNLPAAKCHLVLVNGSYVQPSAFDRHALKPGDTVAMWPPVAGG